MPVMDEQVIKQPLRVQRRLKSRAAILDAALHLFSKDGYEATTFQGIAERAGLHEQTVYRHFSTKAKLADALSDQALARFRSFFSERKVDTMDAWREYVAQRARVRHQDDSRSFFESIPTMQSTNLAYQFRYERILADGLAADMQVDVQHDPTPMMIACMLWGANMHAVNDWARSGGQADLEGAVTAVVDNIRLLFGHVLADSPWR